MSERVQTGGVKSFDYKAGVKRKLGEDKKKEISEAYASHEEKKLRARRNRMLFWIIVLLVVIVGIAFFIF